MRRCLFILIPLVACLQALPASGSYCDRSILVEEEGDETEHAQSPIVACSHGMPIYRGYASSPWEHEDYEKEFFVRADGENVKYLATPDSLNQNSERIWVASGESIYHQPERKASAGRSLASIAEPLPRVASKKASVVYRKAFASFVRSKHEGKLKVESLNGGTWTQKITTVDGKVIFKNAKGFIATLNEFHQWVVVNPRGEVHQILGTLPR